VRLGPPIIIVITSTFYGDINTRTSMFVYEPCFLIVTSIINEIHGKNLIVQWYD
jgi:hypothetical protein